jgi:tetratricopeptide (TPR) repeat protein
MPPLTVLHPHDPAACCRQGDVCEAQGAWDEAIMYYRRALELQPGLLEARNKLSIALGRRGRLAEAIAGFRLVLEQQPAFADAHYNLGVALGQLGQLDEAIAAYRRVLALDPDFVAAHYNLGIALNERGSVDEAIDEYRRVLEIKPGHAEARNNLGSALREAGRIDEALATYRQMLEMHPESDKAKFHYSILLLLSGEFERGWPLYEARWKMTSTGERQFPQPAWDGECVAGRRILIHAEQGLGDSIQFFRYARLLAKRGAEVVAECQRSLLDLFRSAPGVSALVAAGDPLPRFDLHVPMLSLPRLFQTNVESIPAEIPYVFAEPQRRDVWSKRLGGLQSPLKVGLAWTGNPENPALRKRHMALDVLAPLLRLGGVDFISLQVGPGSEQIPQLPAAASIIDHTSHIRDFADTAALLAELDLVISVDTAVAHLAGAMGLPAWTLLPFAPDWRWGLRGDHTPWYPAMRLFRQPAVGDWNSVIQLVAKELERFTPARLQ